METIGDRIRKERKFKGVTQEQLADYVGISVMSIRRYEAMERIPTEKIIVKIANALGVSVPYLKSGDTTSEATLSEHDWKELADFEHIKTVDDLSSERLKDFIKNIPNGFVSVRKEAIRHMMKKSIDESFSILNDEGKQKTVEYMQDLAGNQKYLKPGEKEDK